MARIENIISRLAKKKATRTKNGPMEQITRESDKWRKKHQSEIEKKVKLLDLQTENAKSEKDRRKLVEKTVKMLAKSLRDSHAHTTEVMKEMRAVMDAPSKTKRTAKSRPR